MSKNKENFTLSGAEGNKLVPELRFPEFKDSGEWEEMELGDGLEGGSSQIAKNKLQLGTDGYPIYGADGLIGFVDSYSQSDSYIAIVKDGSGVGNLFLYNGKSSVLGTLTYLKSKNDKKYNIVWFFYLLQRIDFHPYIKGSGIPHIYYKDYSKEVIRIPTPQEQQKIATCLSSLDELMQAETEKHEALKKHKKGLLQQLFPANGDTVPQLRFPEFKGSGEWEGKLLGQVSKITTGSSNREDSTKENGKYTFFDRSEDIRTSNRYLFDGEAIIVAGEGQKFIPKYFIGKFDLHQRAYAIMNFDDKTIGKFLYYSVYINRDYFLRFAVGSTVKSLRLPIFENMPTLIPENPQEQQKIATCLSSLDELITAQAEKIKTLKEHKKGLMQGLFPNINEMNV